MIKLADFERFYSEFNFFLYLIVTKYSQIVEMPLKEMINFLLELARLKMTDLLCLIWESIDRLMKNQVMRYLIKENDYENQIKMDIPSV